MDHQSEREITLYCVEISQIIISHITINYWTRSAKYSDFFGGENSASHRQITVFCEKRAQ